VISLFKQKTPVNTLVIFVFGILIKLPMFLHPHIPTTDKNNAVLYNEILLFLMSYDMANGYLFATITYLLLFSQAMQLNRLINGHRMMQRVNYLPALAYLLVTSLMPEWNYFSAPLLLNTLVLFLMSGLFKIYNQYSIKATIFNIGLLVGIGSFLYFPSLILFFWVILALMVMRTVKLNEWLICLLGITTPYYFYTAWLFISNNWSWEKLAEPVSLSWISLEQSLWLALSGLLLIIPFLAGGYYVQENLRKMLIQVRKNWSLVLIYLLFALCIPFLNNYSKGFENWVLITVPFAAFHAFTYLYPPQRWLPALIFWLTVGYVLFYQYGGPGW
jgi:hypothetical protein